MSTFGEFLYTLRKEKGMTQAELAEALGVTNKAVSKWETGEAMPETSLLLPMSRIFGVTVDELLNGEHAGNNGADTDAGEGTSADRVFIADEISRHIFTRGKDEEVKTLSEKICGAICGTVFFAGLAVYILLGALANLWHPYWVIVPCCALSCGIIGLIFDICNPAKREHRRQKGENPYTGCICGMIMLICCITYILASTFTGLWHPLWVIVVGGGMACFIVGAIGDIFNHKK